MNAAHAVKFLLTEHPGTQRSVLQVQTKVHDTCFGLLLRCCAEPLSRPEHDHQVL